MKIVELVEYLVKNIVKKPDMVSVKQFEDLDEEITIEVLVDKDDMGAIIGKSGMTANSIRNLAQVSAYNQGLKKVKINFDTF